MKVTQEKLEAFVADRFRYAQGNLDCNRSGILDPEYSKYKEAIDRGMGPYLKVVKRPDAEVGLDEKITGLIFEDREGRKHKAYSPKENLYTGGEDFSVGKIIRAKILGDFTELNDYEAKAAGIGIGALGGWLVPTEVSAKVIDMARALAVVQTAGAFTMPMPTPEMRLVKITGDPSAFWVAEHGEITESDWTLEPINLKAMTIGVLVRASLEILEDAKNAGTALEGAMAKALALEMDRVALLGDGVNEPRGLDNADGVNLISKGVNGGTLTSYDDFSDAVLAIANANGQAGAVIMAPRSFYTLDKLKEATTNAPLPAPESYKNLKTFSTNQIGVADTQGTCTTASKAFVGDYRNILYGIRKALEIEVSRTAGQKTFAKCEAMIRCRMRLDIAVLRENHFTKIYGVKV